MGQCLPKADRQRAADGITCLMVADCECVDGGNMVSMSGWGHRTGQLYGVANWLGTTYGGAIGCPEPVLAIVRRCYRVFPTGWRHRTAALYGGDDRFWASYAAVIGCRGAVGEGVRRSYRVP